MRKFKLLLASVAVLLSAVMAFGQNINVSGVVSDENGDPVPQAGVLLSGTTRGVVTDAAGRYTIAVPSDGTLVFSALGYSEQSVPVNGRTSINVVLSENTEQLQETIVVAFGTTTREAFTGSAKVIDSDELAKSQVSAVTSALAGQVAGVQLVQSSGAPGSTPSIRIRGFSSISAGKEPLYIVDGMPYSGDINNINPQDVESMTILKDAASNALYGARGANGVIMITTKRAKSTEAVVTFDAKYGLNSKALRDYEYIRDPGNYYETHYKALYNYYSDPAIYGYDPVQANAAANSIICGQASAGGLGYQMYTVPEGQNFIGTDGKINPAATLGRKVSYQGKDYYLTPDDWNDAAYRKGLRQEYNLSVSAAHDKGGYYASVGYLDNEGITDNSDMNRFTARLKADYQAKKWLKVSGNMSYANFNYNSLSDEGTSNSTGNIWAFTSQIAPIYPLYVRNGDGTIMKDQWGFEMMDYGDGMNAGLSRPFMQNSNALFSNRVNTRNSEGNAFGASGAADISFLKYFTFTINASTSIDESRGTSVSNPYYGQFASSGGSLGKSHSRSRTFNTQQILNYNQAFGPHNVSLMLGHEYLDDTYAYLYGAKQKMYSQDNKELAGAVIDNQNAYSYTSEYNNEGYFSRAEYNYEHKIYASASFRRDASSRFAPERRWGNFWSVGASWIISKEPWFNAPWVDVLKVKTSYGSQGNDNIGSYRYTDLYTVAPSDGEISVSFSSKGNEKITWETNTNFNIGTEFTLFNGVLDGSFEYFSRKTSDMLFWFSVAPSVGYTGYYDNIGDMRNNGVELSLTANIINTRDMNLAVNFNATKVMNKILFLADDVKTLNIDGHDGYNDGSYFIGEGLPLYTRYLKEFAGVGEDGQSLWYKNVKDEDGKITGRETTNQYSTADYYLAPSSIPDWYGGFGLSFYWKGFDFAANFSYQLGGKSFDSGYQNLMGSPTAGSTGTNYHKDILKSWTPDNPSETLPRFQFADNYSVAASTRFLEDASYLNIENINMGYTLPARWTTKVGISSLRIYAAIENVYYWSRRPGFDPRYSFTGATNYSNYSPVRTVSGGVTFRF